MEPFIVFRSYQADDELKCQELIRDYIMSFAKKSFLGFCFREITLQFIVITWAILFIFIGVPLIFCTLTVPLCILFLFSGIYLSFYAKAIELMQANPTQSIVAECYEPYIFRLSPNEVSYRIFMNDSPYETAYKNKYRKKIVAALSIKNHNSLYNAALIYRFAVSPAYPIQKIFEPMINMALKNCIENGYGTLECILSEWQESERDCYDSLGFTTRQVYHKQIIGSSLTVMKTQLTYDLHTDNTLMKQN